MALVNNFHQVEGNESYTGVASSEFTQAWPRRYPGLQLDANDMHFPYLLSSERCAPRPFFFFLWRNWQRSAAVDNDALQKEHPVNSNVRHWTMKVEDASANMPITGWGLLRSSTGALSTVVKVEDASVNTPFTISAWPLRSSAALVCKLLF
jgi:hypothetical protein